MKFKHNLLKYRLVEVETRKVIRRGVRLTQQEADAKNYAFGLNRVGTRYEKV